MKRASFTGVELLVVIAIIAAVVLPVLAQVRQKSHQTVCASNLRQIGRAAMQYSQDHDARLFPAQGWAMGITDGKPDYPKGPLWPYLRSSAVFLCPSAVYDAPPVVPVSFGLNYRDLCLTGNPPAPATLPMIDAPSETILLDDSAFLVDDTQAVIEYDGCRPRRAAAAAFRAATPARRTCSGWTVTSARCGPLPRTRTTAAARLSNRAPYRLETSSSSRTPATRPSMTTITN